MSCVEEVLVWSSKGKYNPQRVGTEKRIVKSSGNTKYVNHSTLSLCEPKEVIGFYQTHYIEMKKHIRGFATRPDSIIELFIKTYTDEGDTILDPTCYQGLSGRIARNMNRRWIGIDKYFMPTELMTNKK
jgi:DNA modification methylase